MWYHYLWCSAYATTGVRRETIFFPVETIAAVGEIKSVLSKTTLSEAIQKLAQVKVLREEVKHPVWYAPCQVDRSNI